MPVEGLKYTSERQIRRIVETAASQKTAVAEQVGDAVRAPDPDVVERWIQQRIKTARENGILMTDRQFADYRTNRTFDVGDYARYIGPDREEKVDDHVVQRPHGQVGRITDVARRTDAVIITFRPLPTKGPDADEELVELVVKQGTKGYLDIERMDQEEVRGDATA